MPEGFFTSSELSTKTPASLVPKCGKCGLYKTCQSPKMLVSGKGDKKILVIGQAPGKHDDRKGGTQYARASNRFFKDALAKVNIDYERDCWTTYAAICRPPEDAAITDRQIEYCRPNLTKTLKEQKPHVIIPVGARAVKSLLIGIWRDDVGEIGRWTGWRIPCRALNAWICPIHQPNYIIQSEKRGETMPVLWWGRHLKAVSALQGRPWTNDPPELDRTIEVYTNPSKAARRIRSMAALNIPFAFDYETNCLKPEVPGSEIVCCAVSWEGRQTIAYPWAGEAIDATRDLLAGPAAKRGANLKFEQRWTKAKLGLRVRNWEWDTMQAAHVLDNRPGISSVKFQAFVRLGVAEYDAAVRPLLKGREDGLNRIRELPIQDVMRYCGMDALLEWKISELQMAEMRGTR